MFGVCLVGVSSKKGTFVGVVYEKFPSVVWNKEVFVEGASKEATIDLYTLDGVRILSSVADLTGRAALNVAGLAEGIYVVLVGNVSKRLIVRH